MFLLLSDLWLSLFVSKTFQQQFVFFLFRKFFWLFFQTAWLACGRYPPRTPLWGALWSSALFSTHSRSQVCTWNSYPWSYLQHIRIHRSARTETYSNYTWWENRIRGSAPWIGSAWGIAEALALTSYYQLVYACSLLGSNHSRLQGWSSQTTRCCLSESDPDTSPSCFSKAWLPSFEHQCHRTVERRHSFMGPLTKCILYCRRQLVGSFRKSGLVSYNVVVGSSYWRKCLLFLSWYHDIR